MFLKVFSYCFFVCLFCFAFSFHYTQSKWKCGTGKGSSNIQSWTFSCMFRSKAMVLFLCSIFTFSFLVTHGHRFEHSCFSDHFFSIIVYWENSTETCILSYVKQIASPGSMRDRVLRAGALGWTLRDGMGREVEGGFRMGNTCTLTADSCQYMAKATTIL